jgi:hypothetical protein
MADTSKEDRIVFGLDDATPVTIDAATKRRMEMWESLNRKIAKLPEAFATIRTLLAVNIFAQLFLAVVIFYK